MTKVKKKQSSKPTSIARTLSITRQDNNLVFSSIQSTAKQQPETLQVQLVELSKPRRTT
jgi:hypothetical protein